MRRFPSLRRLGARVSVVAGAAPSEMTLTGTPDAAELGEAYSWTPTTTNGTAPYSYAISAGALPAWATGIDTDTGAITGTVS